MKKRLFLIVIFMTILSVGSVYAQEPNQDYTCIAEENAELEPGLYAPDGTRVVDAACFKPIIHNGWVYFIKKDDAYNRPYMKYVFIGQLYRYDPAEKILEQLTENIVQYHIEGDWLYYNSLEGYADPIPDKNETIAFQEWGYLHRLQLTQGEGEKLSDLWVSQFTVKDGWIYFSHILDDGQLYKMDNEGKNLELISLDYVIANGPNTFQQFVPLDELLIIHNVLYEEHFVGTIYINYNGSFYFKDFQWDRGRVANALQDGLIKGTAERKLHLDQTITEAEFVAMLMRLINKGENLQLLQTEAQSKSWWAQPYYDIAAQLGLKVCQDQPCSSKLLTRGDAVKIVISYFTHEELDLVEAVHYWHELVHGVKPAEEAIILWERYEELLTREQALDIMYEIKRNLLNKS